MTKRMLVDATHPEEIRVAIVQDNKLIDLDIETSSREQIKGNIYLGRVSRVEPSLQAAFIDFGCGRQGFLSVNDIHPKYYPTSDKAEPRLDFIILPLPEPIDGEDDEEEDEEGYPDSEEAQNVADDGPEPVSPDGFAAKSPFKPVSRPGPKSVVHTPETGSEPADAAQSGHVLPLEAAASAPIAEVVSEPAAELDEETGADEESFDPGEEQELDEPVAEESDSLSALDDVDDDDAMGGDAMADANGDDLDDGVEIDEDGAPLPDTFKRFPRRQRLPIQKILTRGQKLLVQVVKEPRGNKGASLTTNLSLAGRYAVLLPENEGGGGISRKITDGAERKKLKEILETIAIPGQVSLIIRTAGLGRTKREIIRDLNYLLRLWKKILVNASAADGPALIHEEGDLIMRTIRDLYASDMSEILIDGQEGYRRGKDFMRLLMPRYLKVVQPYKDSQPIFSRFQIENQIESMHDRVIQLKSGGYLIIEPTESMVTIDINSGRSTREKDVETTAFKTNLQAAEEIARQLRLRDLGGLIVIDFIDMEEKKHNLEVERQMRDSLKLDRAKIQLGKISQFGLLELSRQRMKPTFSETNRMECPRCKGLGTIRSVESSAIHLFRMLEEDVSKGRYTRIVYRTSLDVANYLLNHKRVQLAELETESKIPLLIHGDESLQTPEFRVERTERPKVGGEESSEGRGSGRGVAGRGVRQPVGTTEEGRSKGGGKPPPLPAPPPPPELPEVGGAAEEPEIEQPVEAVAPVVAVAAEPTEKKKRRRRRRRKSVQQAVGQLTATQDAQGDSDAAGDDDSSDEEEDSDDTLDASGEAVVTVVQATVVPPAAPAEVTGAEKAAPAAAKVHGGSQATLADLEVIEGVRATAAPGLFILARPEPKPRAPEPSAIHASAPVEAPPVAEPEKLAKSATPAAKKEEARQEEVKPEAPASPEGGAKRRTRSRAKPKPAAQSNPVIADETASPGDGQITSESLPALTLVTEAGSPAEPESVTSAEGEGASGEVKPVRRRATRTRSGQPKPKSDPVTVAAVADQPVEASGGEPSEDGEGTEEAEAASGDGKGRTPRRRRRRRPSGAVARRGAGETGEESSDAEGGSSSDHGSDPLSPPWET
ncbi:MAG: Rne/Rng family ribonuclease [Magnetococcus sp. YQC-9]